MNDNYLNLIPELKKIEHTSKFIAKKVLSQLTEFTGQYSSALFWKLCSILYLIHSEEEKLHKFKQWLLTAVTLNLPSEQKIDPFLKAVFTNNTEQIRIHGQEISQYITVLSYRSNVNPYSTTDVPQYFKDISYNFSDKQITGEDLWHLLTNDINPMEKYNLPWIVLLGLYFWYCTETPFDISQAINAFCATRISRNNREHRNDSNAIYYLLNYYSHNENNFINILSSLQHVDAFFFLNIFTAIESRPVDHKEFVFAANNAAYTLIQRKKWEYAALVYDIIGETDKMKAIIAQNASPALEMDEHEQNLVRMGIPEQNLLQGKMNKASYNYQFFSQQETLGQLGTAIDIAFATGDITQAHNLIFNEYIPLMSELGEEMLRALQWVDLFKDRTSTLSPEMVEDVDVLGCVSKAVNGVLLSQNELDFVCRKLGEKWETFSFRREISSLLLEQNGAAQLLERYHVDAVPQDELSSVLAKVNHKH